MMAVAVLIREEFRGNRLGACRGGGGREIIFIEHLFSNSLHTSFEPLP